MRYIPVAQLKASFADVLRDVRHGAEYTITFGKKKEPVAVLVPKEKYNRGTQRKLGILQGRARYAVSDDFAMSEEGLLSL